MPNSPAISSGIRRPASLPPYESDLVCDFFRQIGRFELALRYEKEVRKAALSLLTTSISRSVPPEERSNARSQLKTLLSRRGLKQSEPLAGLVGNAQNPLDHLVGDVFVRSTGDRYFIIEFKREAIGFIQEVDLRHGKQDRVALLGHLQSDDVCQTLSPKGHFGAHWTPNGLHLQSYLTLITSQEQPFTSIQDFYIDVMRNTDWGWSTDELRQYIECMTAHGVPIETDSGNLVFGYFTPEAEFVSMTGSATIVAMILEAFKRGDAHRHQQLHGEGLSATRKSSRSAKPGG